jgi:hypothetical protein
MSLYADSSGTHFYSDITVDGNIINTELQNQLNLKAPLDNPAFTGILAILPPIKEAISGIWAILPTPSSFLSRLEVDGEDALNIYGNGGVGTIRSAFYLFSMA